MAQFQNPLHFVRIASPCSVDWEDMIGNDRRRFCGQCELNVYNLSEMTKRQAEELVNQAEGRLCVRFFRRTDGTILTRDCPIGLRAVKRRISRLKTATVSAVLGFLSGLGIFGMLYEPELRTTMGVMVRDDSGVNEPPLPQLRVETGGVATPPKGLAQPTKSKQSRGPRR